MDPTARQRTGTERKQGSGVDAGYVCACAKSIWSCLTFWGPVDCSLSGCSIHGFLQARILEWAAVPSSPRM